MCFVKVDHLSKAPGGPRVGRMNLAIWDLFWNRFLVTIYRVQCFVSVDSGNVKYIYQMAPFVFGYRSEYSFV